MEHILKSPQEMKTFASQLAKSAKRGDVYALIGSLGAGKTTFAQGFINALSKKTENVTSPTFNLIQIYEAGEFSIWHCDLYRLKNEDEVFNLGLESAFDSNVTLIEWPQLAANILPKNTKYIEIKTLDDDSRKVLVSQLDL